MFGVFLVLVVLVMMVVFTVINVYILAHYSHPLESKFGESLFAKIIIIIALLVPEVMVLLLPLDVSNVQEGGGLDMKGFWYTMTMISMVFIFLIFPIAYFYYETEGDETRSRIWHATKMEFFFLLISAIVLFVTYFPLHKANIPIEDITCSLPATVGTTTDGSSVLQSITSAKASLETDCPQIETSFTADISFAVYFTGLVTFIGSWVLIVFLGVGISAVPIDLIIDFRTRPKKISENKFNNRRNQLLKHVKGLRQEGKRLEGLKEAVDKGKGWKGWKDKRVFNRDLTKFEAKCLIAEKEFVLLEKITELKKVEPWIYWLKLFAGCILIILSFVWFVHILLWVLIRPNNHAVHPMLNDMLEGFRASHMEFLSTGAFAVLALYLLW